MAFLAWQLELDSIGDVAEQADAKVSKTFKGNLVWVRFPPSPPISTLSARCGRFASRRSPVIAALHSAAGCVANEKAGVQFSVASLFRGLGKSTPDLSEMRIRLF